MTGVLIKGGNLETEPHPGRILSKDEAEIEPSINQAGNPRDGPRLGGRTQILRRSPS